MADSLTWTTSSRSPDATLIRLTGDINERFAPGELELELEIVGSRVVLVLDSVRYINSSGVKRLLEFLSGLAERYTIEAERCSPTLVNQLNLMPALAACMTIRSVVAPLECSECVAEAHTLVVVDTVVPTPPTRSCEVCGADMLLADLPERYFAFVAAATKPARDQ